MSTPPHSFDEIMQRLAQLSFGERYDMIVAIANGGILPAALLHERLPHLPVHLLHINWRNTDNTPRGPMPTLQHPPSFDPVRKNILLAEDRIKTGTTQRYARQVLHTANLIHTFAINGDADYALYNEPCFPLPWRF
ncbi:MAG: hypothetical protein LBD14_02515 [Puniceicoccales bacterium]|jgi:xanthine phosphoribosyltransferase|nr:hypothetical protein [Puniceicoccales bacterium]